jgi:hypothetical protein
VNDSIALNIFVDPGAWSRQFTISIHPKVLKTFKKHLFIAEKVYVRIWAYFTLMFFVYSAMAYDCFLTPEQKNSFIKSSPYPVDDIKCVDKKHIWNISNKRYFIQNTVAKKNRTVASVKQENKTLKKNEVQKKPTQALFVGLYSGIASISSVDTTANAKAEATASLGYGLTLAWTHFWTDKISFFAVGSLKKFDFKVASNRTISKGSVTHGYVGAGVNFKLGERFVMTPGLGVGESLILNSNGGNSLFIDKINIPTISLSTKTKLTSFKNGFSFDLKTRVGLMLPTDQKGIKTKTGYYYNLGLGSSYDLSGKMLLIDASYTGRKLKIGTANQGSKDIGLSVGVGWSF